METQIKTRKRHGYRKHWIDKYGLSYKVALRLMPSFLEQLKACKSEAARRILLGVSK